MTYIESELPLTDEEIQEAEEAIETLRQKVDDYRCTAQEINDRKINNDPRSYVRLDDQPFGEELLRTEGIPRALDTAIDLLNSIQKGALSTKEKIEAGRDVIEIIEESESTLDDCTPVPSEEEDEESYY